MYFNALHKQLVINFHERENYIIELNKKGINYAAMG